MPPLTAHDTAQGRQQSKAERGEVTGLANINLSMWKKVGHFQGAIHVIENPCISAKTGRCQDHVKNNPHFFRRSAG